MASEGVGSNRACSFDASRLSIFVRRVSFAQSHRQSWFPREPRMSSPQGELYVWVWIVFAGRCFILQLCVGGLKAEAAAAVGVFFYVYFEGVFGQDVFHQLGPFHEAEVAAVGVVVVAYVDGFL